MSETTNTPDDARRPRKPKSCSARRPWSTPRIEPHGSIRHLVRGATGPIGDPGSALGKRTN